MGFNLTPKLVVREAMSSPVISVTEDENLKKAAKLMRDYKVGAIIILTDDEQPVGIVTERDIVNKVVAEGIAPSDISAKQVMSSPLRVVESETSLLKAMSLMDKHHIRRLGVHYKGKLAGIVTERDILRIMPTLVEIMREKNRVSNIYSGTSPSFLGYCDRCESYSRNLVVVEGEFLCEECRTDD
jgi:predicted transcriptional regulator